MQVAAVLRVHRTDLCELCGVVAQTDRDDLVVCDVCRITVHKVRGTLMPCSGLALLTPSLTPSLTPPVYAMQACYGATLEDGTTSWPCDVCSSDTVIQPRCVLCPRVGGAFKPTSSNGKPNGKWVHLFCALMVPGVHFENPDQMTGIDVRRVHKEVRRRSCDS